MSKTTFLGGTVLVLAFVAYGLWLGFASVPSESEIEVLRQPLAPLPVLKTDVLTSSEFTNRKINGPLPLDTNSVGIGREDPFAQR